MDMHLMTLKTLAIEMGMETPDIFKDETYLRMHRYGLLTSQVISSTVFRVLVMLKLIFLLPNRKEYKNNRYLIIINGIEIFFSV